MNETEWQAQVVELAQINGWRHLHVRRTIGRGRKWVTSTNVTGWPDLLLWHPKDGRIGALELKVRPNKPTTAQIRVLAELAASGAEFALVAYPDDLGMLCNLLSRRIWRKGREYVKTTESEYDPALMSVDTRGKTDAEAAAARRRRVPDELPDDSTYEDGRPVRS